MADQQGEQPLPIIGDEDIPVFYANATQTASTYFDFTYVFGQNWPQPGRDASIRASVRIVMSPQHAKIFSKALTENLRQYEETFGVMPDPPPGQHDVRRFSNLPSVPEQPS